MRLTDEYGNEVDPTEWLIEAVGRMAAEVECISDHVHNEDWMNTVLHLRQMHKYVPFIAEVIITTKMTKAQVTEMMKAEMSERLGVDLTDVTIITDPADMRAALEGVTEDELRSFFEQQGEPTTEAPDEQGGGWTDVPPVP